MDDKEKIVKLQKIIWEYAGCTECIHEIRLRNECGNYPDCAIGYCKEGKYFECK